VADRLLVKGATFKARAARNAHIVREAEREEAAALVATEKSTAFRPATSTRGQGRTQKISSKPGMNAIWLDVFCVACFTPAVVLLQIRK
jgi:hypothetical protein